MRLQRITCPTCKQPFTRCTCPPVEHDNEAKHALHILKDGEWTEAYHDELDERWAQWKRIDDDYRQGGM